MTEQTGNNKPNEAEGLGFPLSGNEKLIEEAKHLIEQAGSFREQVGDDASPTSMIGLWLRTADALHAALAEFEKALTPTDDEQEALVKRLEDEVEYRVRTAVALHKGGHDHGDQVRKGRASVRFIAAGFRRSEVQEPSAREDEFTPGECDGSGKCPAETHVHGCYMPHRADQCDSPDEYGHLPAEPQGEPSDAQVNRDYLAQVIHKAVYSRIPLDDLTDEAQADTYKRADAVVAALRAAGGVR